jgi:pilus assembly protein CpaB
MFRSGSTLALAIALVVGGIAAYVVRIWLSPAAASPGTIVVAAAPLGFGMPLTVDNLIEIPWDSTTLPEGAFATKRALLKDGRRDVLRPIGRREPVLSAKITAPGRPGTLAALIDEGKRAVTVRVDDVRGVAGFVSPGDRVDVVLIRSDTRNESYSDIILQRAMVLAVDQVAGERVDRPTIARAVTLEATPEEAQKILLAANVGKISLILRESDEITSSIRGRVTEQDLGHNHSAARVDEETPMTTVSIVRGTKVQDYSVVHDTRR